MCRFHQIYFLHKNWNPVWLYNVLKIHSLWVSLMNMSDSHWFGEDPIVSPHPMHVSNYHQQPSRWAAEGNQRTNVRNVVVLICSSPVLLSQTILAESSFDPTKWRYLLPVKRQCLLKSISPVLLVPKSQVKIWASILLICFQKNLVRWVLNGWVSLGKERWTTDFRYLTIS